MIGAMLTQIEGGVNIKNVALRTENNYTFGRATKWNSAGRKGGSMLVIVHIAQLAALCITTTFFPHIAIPTLWQIGASKRLDVAKRKSIGCIVCEKSANDRLIEGTSPKQDLLFKSDGFWFPSTMVFSLSRNRYQAKIHSFTIFMCVLCLQAFSIGACDVPISAQTARAPYG